MRVDILLFSNDLNYKSEMQKLIREYSSDVSLVLASDLSEMESILSSRENSILLIDFGSKAIDLNEIIAMVKEKYPEVFRILIYEQSKREAALYSSPNVHRFLQKPIKSEELKKTLDHFLRLKETKLDAKIISSINDMGATPILPDIYWRLEREITKKEISIHRIADIISDDPSVAAKILHIIYASFYNVSKGVVNLIHAINFLGLDIIKHLVLYVKIFTVKNLSAEAQGQLKHLRDHSILVAKVAKAIMNLEVKNRDQIDAAYIAGLLHDIGKILLIQAADKPKRTNDNGKSNGEINEIANEVSHSSVGAYLLSLWNFPTQLVDAISNHHNSEVLSKEAITLNQVVFIANTLINSNAEDLKKIEEVHGKEKLQEWIDIIPTKINAA